MLSGFTLLAHIDLEQTFFVAITNISIVIVLNGVFWKLEYFIFKSLDFELCLSKFLYVIFITFVTYTYTSLYDSDVYV